MTSQSSASLPPGQPHLPTVLPEFAWTSSWPQVAPGPVWVDLVQSLLWGDEVTHKEKELTRKKISILALELLKHGQDKMWLW